MLSKRFLPVIVLAICVWGSLGAPVPSTAQTPTSETPTKQINYWDMGLSVKVPPSWTVPVFAAGQMVIYAKLPETSATAVTPPTLAFQFFNAAGMIGLPKDAPFDVIATQISGGQNTTIVTSGPTTLAGLDATIVNLDKQPKPNSDEGRILGSTIVTRLIDGRIGIVVFVSSRDAWPDYYLLTDKIRQSVGLLKTADYPVPTFSNNQKTSFTLGGVSFSLPDKWVSKASGKNGMYFHSPDDSEYADTTGFVNGPQLVIRNDILPTGSTVQDALVKIASLSKDDKVTEIKLGNQAAWRTTYVDLQSNQYVTLIAFAASDKKTFNTLRWTVPGMLIEVMAPTLDKILTSIQFVSAP